jgi:hypothetical protein
MELLQKEEHTVGRGRGKEKEEKEGEGGRRRETEGEGGRRRRGHVQRLIIRKGRGSLFLLHPYHQVIQIQDNDIWREMEDPKKEVGGTPDDVGEGELHQLGGEGGGEDRDHWALDLEGSGEGREGKPRGVSKVKQGRWEGRR